MVCFRLPTSKCVSREVGIRLMEAPRSSSALLNVVLPIMQDKRGVPGSFILVGRVLEMMELACSERMIGLLPF